MVLGLAIGYFVFWFRKVRLGKSITTAARSMLIPFVSAGFGVLTYYVIGPVMSDLMGGLLHFLNTIPPSMKFAAAFLVGAMLAFDMGGPINKTAWFFCFSLLEKHIYDWYAIVGVVIADAARRGGSCDVHCAKLFPRRKKRLPVVPLWSVLPRHSRTGYSLRSGSSVADDYRQYAGGRHYRRAGDRFRNQTSGTGLGIFDPLIGLMSPVGSFYLVLAIGSLNISFVIV